MKTSEELANAVKSYQNGDREAFATVYEQSYRYLRACVMHVVREEEAAQDMHKNLLAEDMDETFEEIPDDMALIPEEMMQDGEKRRLIREIIDGLSDMQRLCGGCRGSLAFDAEDGNTRHI